jgi:hypothetical protein
MIFGRSTHEEEAGSSILSGRRQCQLRQLLSDAERKDIDAKDIEILNAAM